MKSSRLHDLRRRGERLAASEDEALAAAGRTLRSLAGALERGETVDPERLEKIRGRARAAAASGDADLRAAARSVLAVAHELAAPKRGRRRPPRRALAVAVGVVAVALALAGGVAAARTALAPSLTVRGPSNGTILGAVALTESSVVATGKAARWRVDGRDVGSRVHGGRLDLSALALRDGEHVVEVTSTSGFLGMRRTRRVAFRVDRTPPAIRLAHAPTAHAWSALLVSGRVEEGSRLTIGGRAVAVTGDNFSVRYTPPLPHRLAFVAVDRAGNRTVENLRVALEPRRPPVPVRAVHVTSYAWMDKTLHAGVMQLIDQHRVNAVELDLKDEAGIVGFGAAIPLAKRFGASQKIYDLPKTVKFLHARGIRVIGRIVCFRDPIFAPAAWKSGHRDWVIQTPSHEPYSGYGGFANFANPAVRRYQIDIAVAAARAGVDDILYDYVRRPDGPISTMVFPGLRGPPENAIVQFLQESRRALEPFGTYLGASVFGVAATRPREVAQPIRRMAQSVDYVAPMVYPSHWGPGEYDVANPNAEPYEIVLRSLRDFARDVRGSGARVVPWLQDFTLGVTYGPNEVRAQIDAAKRDGIGEFILWDPAVTYTTDALSPNAPVSKRGLAKVRRSSPRRAAAHHTAARHKVSKAPPVRRVDGRLPNELGQIPVIMHHEIRPDRVGPYDQTPAEFRAELARLWRDGYWPVSAAALVGRDLGRVPAGKTPVVLTFDDSTRYQLFFKGRKLVPNTAVAIMEDFAKTHPRFRPRATFYVLREPWGGVPQGAQWTRWLVAHGFDLGNHTKDHLPLRTLSDADVRRELALGARVITDAVHGYRIRTMALPLGSMPRNEHLARRGRWRGVVYSDNGVFLVGANPAPSPFSRGWDPNAIPRIRSSHAGWNGEQDFGAAYWLHELDAHPETRYVSDGDPAHVTFPRARAADLAPRFRKLARPY